MDKKPLFKRGDKARLVKGTNASMHGGRIPAGSEVEILSFEVMRSGLVYYGFVAESGLGNVYEWDLAPIEAQAE